MDSTHERTFALTDGRTLAYTTSGNASSTTVVLYLHGAFTVGNIRRLPVALKDFHYVCPTLPGWGNTSPPGPSTPYIDCLTSDMTTLLDHLYPENGRDIKLCIAGGSFGTVPTQILYGAPYDKFPYGRCIVGVLLIGGIPPFRYHKDYAKHMSWVGYVTAGPLSQWFPFNYLLPFAVRSVLVPKLNTVENAERFFRKTIFDKMDEAEKEAHAGWREEQGVAEGEMERRFAMNAVRSVATSWQGYTLMSSILHSDWGFRPDALDKEHSRPLVMLVTGPGDKEAPQEWTQYLATTYKNTKIKTLHGGHTSILYYMDDVWAEFLAGIE